MKGIVAASCLCALALSATACGERSEPTGPIVRIYPVSLTGAGGAVTRLDSRPRRILALGAGMRPTMRAIGVGPRTSTATASLDSPNLGRFDLVAAWASTEQADMLLQRPPRGTEVYVAPDNSIEAVERSLADLGLLVGRPVDARRVVNGIERKRTQAQARVGRSKPVTVFLDTGFFTTVSSDSLQGQMIREAGGRDVTGKAPQSGPIGLAQLRRLDPDYYLTTSDTGVRLSDLRKNPGTRHLRAVRAGHFAIVPAQLFQAGPSVGNGVIALARVLHPDAFR